MIKKYIKTKLYNLYSTISRQPYTEAHATRLSLILSPLTTNWTYLPWTNWAAGPEFYVHICNDIVINKKKNIIEFGSGVSTLLLARLIKLNGLSVHILSIDHDQEWQETISKILKNEHTEEYVHFINADIVKEGEYTWYDKNKITVPDNFLIDTVIVDGPIGGKPMARLGAIPFIQKKLSQECYTIYLHDTDREDEMNIIQEWSKLLPNATVNIKNRYTVLQFGTKFCFEPQTVI